MHRALTIQEISRRSGFTGPTLRYYERIGLLGAVGRDPASGHRRYEESTVARVDALACLRSSGVSVEGMRRYVDLLGRGDEAAGDLRELFAGHAGRIDAEIDRLRVRRDYLAFKAQMWEARQHADRAAEADAVRRVEEILTEF